MPTPSRYRRCERNPWGGGFARRLAGVAGFFLAAWPAGDAAALEIVVPAYFYPSSSGSDWDDLDTAAGDVPVTAIMNPGNGPGGGFNSDYGAATASFTAAGGNLIGYVYSQYGSRPINQVLADIDSYAQWYPLDGIFVDEFSNSSDPLVLDYYNTIYDHVKSIDPGWEVMGNPGINTSEVYLTRPAADRLMVFESFGANYPSHQPSAWNDDYDSSRFVNLLHTQSDAATALDYVDVAVQRNVGGVYFTDDVLGNPWDRLPTYWDQFVEKVAQVNNQVVGPLQTLSNPVADGVITADASRADWAGLTPFDADAVGDTASPLDLAGVTMANDSDELFVRLTLDGGGETPPGLGSAHRVYLDIDNDRATGFYGDGGGFAIGADYLLLDDRLFLFQGSTQDTFSWNFLQEVPADDSTTDDLEWALPLSTLGDPAAIDFLVQTNGAGGPDFLPDAGATGASGNAYRYEVGAAPLAGDYDGDGDVDADDYTRWADRFETDDPLADGNGDGLVDAADYTVWRDANAASAAEAVPEPGAGLLAGCVAYGLAFRRHPAADNKRDNR